MPLTSQNDRVSIASPGKISILDGTSALYGGTSPDADGVLNYTVNASTSTYLTADGTSAVQLSVYNDRLPGSQTGTFTRSTITVDESFSAGLLYLYSQYTTYDNADQVTVLLPKDWTVDGSLLAANQDPNDGYFPNYFSVPLYTLNGTVDVRDADGNIRFQLSAIGFENQAGDSGVENVCFTRGAQVLCENGQRRAIEDLRAGDLVWTKDHGMLPIRWIGSTNVSDQTLAQFPQRRPVRIAPNTFGEHDALIVSQQHRIMLASALFEGFFDSPEVLIPAKHLVDGERVTIVDDGLDVEYFHIMFDQHQILDVDGVLSESYQPGEWSLKGMSRATRDEIIMLFPEAEINPNGVFKSARRSLSRSEVKTIGL